MSLLNSPPKVYELLKSLFNSHKDAFEQIEEVETRLEKKGFNLHGELLTFRLKHSIQKPKSDDELLALTYTLILTVPRLRGDKDPMVDCLDPRIPRGLL